MVFDAEKIYLSERFLADWMEKKKCSVESARIIHQISASCTILGKKIVHPTRFPSLRVSDERGSLSGSSEKKIRARPSFNKSLTNYTSEQSLINGVYDKNIF